MVDRMRRAVRVWRRAGMRRRGDRRYDDVDTMVGRWIELELVVMEAERSRKRMRMKISMEVRKSLSIGMAALNIDELGT